VLLKRLPPEKAQELALSLSDGRWTHDFPITVEAPRSLGLPISTDVPPILYELMDLYPQASARRPSVLHASPAHAGGASAGAGP
jgi:hypothetical protein